MIFTVSTRQSLEQVQFDQEPTREELHAKVIEHYCQTGKAFGDYIEIRRESGELVTANLTEAFLHSAGIRDGGELFRKT